MRIAAVALLAMAFPAQAQTVWSPDEVRRQVAAIAFDPSRFFDHDAEIRDTIRISYAGDDQAWPVYSIAIRNRCEPGAAAPGCQHRHIARMLRAPAPPAGTERPRWR